MTVKSVLKSRFTMNNIAPKLQKCWTRKITFKIISKMLKQPKFFCIQLSTRPKEALVKFYLSTTFGLSFTISSVAPTRSSTSYAYLITKIRKRNIKVALFSTMMSAKMTKQRRTNSTNSNVAQNVWLNLNSIKRC